MDILPKVPAAAKSTGLPIGGTLILLMMPDHWPNWPAWSWGVLWTLWAVYWLLCIVSLYQANKYAISEKKWREVFK